MGGGASRGHVTWHDPVVRTSLLFLLLPWAVGCASTGSTPAPTAPRADPPPEAARPASADERCSVNVNRESTMTVVGDVQHGFAVALPANGYRTSCVAHGNELLSATRDDLGFTATVTLNRLAEGQPFDETTYLTEMYEALVARFRGSEFALGPRRDPPPEAGATLLYAITGTEDGVAKTSFNAWHVISLPGGYVLRHHVSWTMATAEASSEHEAVVAVTASLIRLLPPTR